jgi:hypothetical protein
LTQTPTNENFSGKLPFDLLNKTTKTSAAFYIESKESCNISSIYKLNLDLIVIMGSV